MPVKKYIYILTLFLFTVFYQLATTNAMSMASGTNSSYTTDSIPPKESVKTARWFVEGKEVSKQEGVDLYYDYQTSCWIEDNPKEAIFKYGEKARDGIAICILMEEAE